ncbi:MAG: thioredoxin domain-containing protein [Chloroflexi bacterium]|nr:thioredoxin domain-containing protein [Chloroflexota bacterium]
MPNRLVAETSPYLLQHADNPVDWYPWGEAAFERARSEDRPILLSIGYSACHWCHVMERESFEDEPTAALMNQLFVSIKVDREERPDLDGIYMAAVQGLTGRGGWPMTVFLTPEGKPFYGGTYFPPSDRPGMPAFKRVLQAIADAYRSRREEVTTQAEALQGFIRQQNAVSPPADSLDSTILDAAVASLAHNFDRSFGGFGAAPKFPQPMALDFLLRYHRRTGSLDALAMVEQSLRHMACGGIYDQIGGGFHRYSVDEIWRVPHFEKMLYDNALLPRVYLHAFQITGLDFYREITEATLAYVLREMRQRGGGFYSAQDADSEGEEGSYYVWTPKQVREVVGAADAEIVCQYFGISESGNFAGRNICTRPVDAADFAAGAGVSLQGLLAIVDRARLFLLEARSRRIRPATDDKILCAWNGLQLRTLAEAFTALGRPEYRTAAESNASFLLDVLWHRGRLPRAHRGSASSVGGFLEDYGALADGLLALYEATFETKWFAAARELTEAMLDLFWDAASETLRDTAKDAEELLVRPKELWDNATPSGTSLACHVLLRLWALTGERRYESIVRRELARATNVLGKHAVGRSYLTSALDFYLAPPTEVAIISDPERWETRWGLRPLRQAFLPNAVFASAGPDDREAAAAVPLLQNRPQLDGKPTVYVCRGFVCDQPTTDFGSVLTQLTARQ